jgi:hypothetical protein
VTAIDNVDAGREDGAEEGLDALAIYDGMICMTYAKALREWQKPSRGVFRRLGYVDSGERSCEQATGVITGSANTNPVSHRGSSATGAIAGSATGNAVSLRESSYVVREIPKAVPASSARNSVPGYGDHEETEKTHGALPHGAKTEAKTEKTHGLTDETHGLPEKTHGLTDKTHGLTDKTLSRLTCVIADECHIIPAKKVGKFFRGLQRMHTDTKIVSLTATLLREAKGFSGDRERSESGKKNPKLGKQNPKA